VNWLDRSISATLPFVPKPIVRFFSRRYIAGTSTEDAFSTVRELAQSGAMSTLDILGEFISTPEEAQRNTEGYVELIRRIGDERLEDTHVSVKLTALGLLMDRQLCFENVRRLVQLASESGNFVRIDMEDSPCTTETLRINDTLREEFPGHVGVVLQSRLRRTLDDIKRVATEGTNIRLCKGIYLEPRDVAYTDAELIRLNFIRSLELLFERGCYVGIATHDERLVWHALQLIEKYGLTREAYEFQMLLGVDEQMRRMLLDAGHRMRVYVPFGKHWYQYSVRRLRENPQIAGYAFKAIFQRSSAR